MAFFALDRALTRPGAVRRRQAIYWSLDLDTRSAVPIWAAASALAGFPSSGTNWLCNLVSCYFGVPVFEPWMRLTPTLATACFSLTPLY